MYIDRMMKSHVSLQNKELRCPLCKELLGTRMIYQKEQRLAYRLFAGSIKKQIMNSQNM